MFTCRRTLLSQIYSSSTNSTTYGNIPTELASLISIATTATATRARPRVRQHSKPKVTTNTANSRYVQQSRYASTRARYMPIQASFPEPGPSASKHSEPLRSSPNSKSRTGKGAWIWKGKGKEGKEKVTIPSRSSLDEARVTLEEYLRRRGDTSEKRRASGNFSTQDPTVFGKSKAKRTQRSVKRDKGKEKASEPEKTEHFTMTLQDYHSLITEAWQAKNDRALNWLIWDVLELPLLGMQEELQYSPNPLLATVTEDTPSISSSLSTDSTASAPLYHAPGYEELPKDGVLPQLNMNSIPDMQLNIPPHLDLPPLESPSSSFSSSQSFSGAFSTSSSRPSQAVNPDIYTSTHTFLHHLVFSLDLSRLWGKTALGILQALSSTFTVTLRSTSTTTSTSFSSNDPYGTRTWIDSLPHRRFRWLVVQLCTRLHPKEAYSDPGEKSARATPMTKDFTDETQNLVEEGVEETDLALLRLVYPRVLRHMVDLPLSEHADINKKGAPDAVYVAFMVLRRLLQLRPVSGEESRVPKEAIDLFSQLLQVGWVPVEAVYSMPESESSADEEQQQERLRTILSMTLARACVRWDFRMLGMKVLDAMLIPLAPSLTRSRFATLGSPHSEEWSSSIDTSLVDLIPLTQDVLYASLVSPRPSEFRACVGLIKRLCTLAAQEIEGVGVEDVGLEGLIRTCYIVGMQNRFTNDCVGLYAFTRGYGHSEIQAPQPQGRRLAGPPGQVVLWMFKAIVEDGVGARPEASPHAIKVTGGAQSWLARELACEVAGIPSTTQPFNTEPSGVPPPPPIFLPAPNRAEFIALAASQGFAGATRVLYTRYSKGKDRALVVGSPGVLTRAVGCFESVRRTQEAKAGRKGVISHSGTREEGKDLPLEGDCEGELLDTQVYREREQDLRMFLDHIINSYVEVYIPLEDAKHEVITSLARAYFIVGKVKEGFDAFKVLLQRNEVPDMHDMNTALTVLAEDSPRSAAKLVYRMVARGIQPDTVTLGILLKWGLAHGDKELVRDVLSQWGHLGLDMKGVDMWIRGSIKQAGGKKEAVRDAYELLRDLPGQGHGIARNVGLGKYLVFCALRAGDVMLGRAVFRDLVCTTGDREMEFMRQILKINK
ncbi:hypothetical protein PQX77_000523 [Marasmius sp. AFHP31]|nr:hypothetical protein PQX77_000523 [Marasmius sp. AFHP31]